MPKPVYEEGDVTVLWNQAVHTDREVTANRPDIIIKNRKEKTCTLIDVAVTSGINVMKKGRGKEVEIQEFMYRDTTNIIVKGKGKAAPLLAWSGPEGSRKLRFPDFMTTAQDGGKVVSLTHRPPLSQEIHLVRISVRG